MNKYKIELLENRLQNINEEIAKLKGQKEERERENGEKSHKVETIFALIVYGFLLFAPDDIISIDNKFLKFVIGAGASVLIFFVVGFISQLIGGKEKSTYELDKKIDELEREKYRIYNEINQLKQEQNQGE